MPHSRLAYLFEKYYDKTATPEEVAEFMRLVDMDEHAGEILALMEQAWKRSAPTRQVGRIWRRVAAAAVLVGVLGGTAWWLMQGPAAPQVQLAQRPLVKPGTSKALLILGDGSMVTLDSVHRGALARQGNTEIVAQGGGRLAYEAHGGASEFNTIRTPRGGQYQVTLPDGSRVWLNAASSLRFPTTFDGKDRSVELTGEAYFEITARSSQPFKVKVGDTEVDVLGTHFNVMAYDDEGSINTSLLQGSVRVGNLVLTPGEEARLDRQTGVLKKTDSDTEQVVAWKNGLFQFEGATIETIMRQVGRWYDVDVRYEGDMRRHFSGEIPRSAGLGDVLHMLELAGPAKFNLEGRTVTVKAE
jgi:ferric-dicitrate binding protein FerR (iron transport regulator)